MLEYIRQPIRRIEGDATIVTREAAIRELSKLGLSEFAEFMISLPDPEFPHLSALLPAMASADVQQQWTGGSGLSLLRETTAFVLAVAYNFNRLTGRHLDGVRILDFGCGYGRIGRAMYYFTPPDSLYSVDPLEAAISACRECGMTENVSLSDDLPETLPVGDTQFDLIYAFSVFTHLSRRATQTALRTLRRYVTPNGMLTITIRPVEFWQEIAGSIGTESAARMTDGHKADGFTFLPHNREPIDGDVTYGDTSMTLEWLAAECSNTWQVAAVDRATDVPYQIYVFLRPI